MIAIERNTTALAEMRRIRSLVYLARFIEDRAALDAEQIEATLDVVEMLCQSAIDHLEQEQAVRS